MSLLRHIERSVAYMTFFSKTDIEVLQSRKLVFETKVAQERVAIRSGSRDPGDPVECPSVPGETRRARLLRWEDTAKALNRVVANLTEVSVKDDAPSSTFSDQTAKLLIDSVTSTSHPNRKLRIVKVALPKSSGE
jgi:hypothetical protein